MVISALRRLEPCDPDLEVLAGVHFPEDTLEFGNETRKLKIRSSCDVNGANLLPRNRPQKQFLFLRIVLTNFVRKALTKSPHKPILWQEPPPPLHGLRGRGLPQRGLAWPMTAAIDGPALSAGRIRGVPMKGTCRRGRFDPTLGLSHISAYITV